MRTVRRHRRMTSASLSVALALGVSACGGGGSGADSADGRVQVVTSTNVWASVVAAVGGEHVEVTSVIDDPSVDPHSYQAVAADAASVRSAELLVRNGGGYDDFFTRLAEGVEAPVVVAVDQAEGEPSAGHGNETDSAHSDPAGHGHGDDDGHGHGHEHGHEQGHDNEHVWYDLDTVTVVADRVAAELGKLLPQQRQAFEAGAEDFTRRLGDLQQELGHIAEKHAGTSVVATEPIAAHLLLAAELEDATPPEFAAAVENETDVPAAAQQRMLELVSGEVDAVVRNTQTVTPATENVVGAAEEAGTPVVDVTETLPEGRGDYVSWMGDQIDALANALDM